MSKIARSDVAPSAFSRSCYVCGEPFGAQCFGAVMACDLQTRLDRPDTRELCIKCVDFYESAHYSRGSLAQIGRSPRAWWRAIKFWWPRRHRYDDLKREIA